MRIIHICKTHDYQGNQPCMSCALNAALDLLILKHVPPENVDQWIAEGRIDIPDDSSIRQLPGFENVGRSRLRIAK